MATTQADVTSGTVSPAQIAVEIKQQGGSDQQAWVGSALASGIESGGQLNDKNPSSTACGLFQFLTTTWASNGGTKYAATACQASLAQQVAVFLTASSGDNFYPWAPDLGGSYNGKPIAAPAAGSPVANKLNDSNFVAEVAGAIKANVPTQWIIESGVVPASPTPIPLGNDGVNVGAGVAGSLNPIKSVDSFFAALGSGFGLGWTGIFTIVLGGLLIIVGLIFLFHKQAVKIGEAAALA